MTIAASPTLVLKSDAICGRSESVTRTIAWLANPAPASRMIERSGTFAASGGEGARTSIRSVIAVEPIATARGHIPCGCCPHGSEDLEDFGFVFGIDASQRAEMTGIAPV